MAKIESMKTFPVNIRIDIPCVEGRTNEEVLLDVMSEEFFDESLNPVFSIIEGGETDGEEEQGNA